MSQYETVPVGVDEGDWWQWSEAEREEWLVDAFKGITAHGFERRHLHDRDGFMADLAYETKCLALGHTRSVDDETGELEPEDDDELARDGTHVPSWDGEMLCGDTRYGAACTECEGECDYIEDPPSIWGLPGVLAAPALAEGAEPIHDAIACIEWCNHCTVCGEGVLYGSRCPAHENRTSDISGPSS